MVQRHQQQMYIHKHSVQERLQMAREIPLQAHMPQNPAYNYGASQHYQQVEQVQQFDNLSQQQQQERRSNMQDYGHFDDGSGDYRDKHQVYTLKICYES